MKLPAALAVLAHSAGLAGCGTDSIQTPSVMPTLAAHGVPHPMPAPGTTPTMVPCYTPMRVRPNNGVTGLA
jgi:hypothetical protein